MEEKNEEILDAVDTSVNNAQSAIPDEIPVQEESSVPIYEAPVEQEPVQTEPTEEVAPVAPIPPVEETSKEMVTEDVVKPVEPVKTEVEVNEHPDAKIELNQEKKESIQPELSTEEKGDYKALKFAIIIGVIILAAIIILPRLISKFLI